MEVGWLIVAEREIVYNRVFVWCSTLAKNSSIKLQHSINSLGCCYLFVTPFMALYVISELHGIEHVGLLCVKLLRTLLHQQDF